MFASNFATSDLLTQGCFREAGGSVSDHHVLETPHRALGFGGAKRLEWLDLNEEASAASSESLN